MSSTKELGKGESPRVNTRNVLIAMASFLVLMSAVAFGFTLLFSDRIDMPSLLPRSFPAPGVIPDERGERLSLEMRQRQLLAGGNGRLPISQAMKAIVARGPRAFDPVQ